LPGSGNPIEVAYSLNVTVAPPGPLVFISLWPTGSPQPNVSTLNYGSGGPGIANAAIVPAGTSGAIQMYASNATDVIVDVDGYFALAPQAQQGPQGPAGPPGPAGAQGPVGAIGPAGPIGQTGPQGPAGPMGATGPQGPVGPAGATGAQGTPGATGPQGLTGPVGPQGPQGPAGASGTGNGTNSGPLAKIGNCGTPSLYIAVDQPKGQQLYVCDGTSWGQLGALGPSGALAFDQNGNLDATSQVPLLYRAATFTNAVTFTQKPAMPQ